MKAKITQGLSEGWVIFTRHECEYGGYIDMWVGDCINDPNNIAKSNLQLNSTATYFRLNDSRWHSKRDFIGDFQHHLRQLMTGFTAQEIWDAYFIKEALTNP